MTMMQGGKDQTVDEHGSLDGWLSGQPQVDFHTYTHTHGYRYAYVYTRTHTHTHTN